MNFKNGLSIGIIGCLFLASNFCLPRAMAGDTNHGDVVVRENADGSISTYDASDPAVNATPSGGDGKVIYGVHGAGKPYTRKHSDGVVVRRNPDGSIETSSPEEVHTFQMAPRATSKKRTYKKRSRKSSKRSSKKRSTAKSSKKKSVKKSPKKAKPALKPLKRGSLLK